MELLNGETACLSLLQSISSSLGGVAFSVGGSILVPLMVAVVFVSV
jgi:hypothetical protein